MRKTRSILTGLIAFVLSACGGGGSSPGSTAITVPTTSSAAQIWIQPKPDNAGGTGLLAGGSTDFTSLFSSTASWPATAAHTTVFGFYAGWIADIDTPTLTTIVNF